MMTPHQNNTLRKHWFKQRYDQVSVTAHTTFANVTISLSGLLTLQYKPVNGFNNQILRMLLKR